MPITLTRSHWLWIADAARCLDRTGRELPDVAPGMQVRGRHWWACDRRTRAGDEAILVVGDPASTLAYLVEVVSDAREPRPWEAGPATPHVCDYRVVARLSTASASASAPDADLDRWVRVTRAGSYVIPEATWAALRERARS